MIGSIRGKLSFANVMSMTAVMIALGGTSYAATLARNSVGSAQIKAKAVKNSDLGDSAVTSAKVHNGSLRVQDFAAGQIPAGPAVRPARPGLRVRLVRRARPARPARTGLRGSRGTAGTIGARHSTLVHGGSRHDGQPEAFLHRILPRGSAGARRRWARRRPELRADACHVLASSAQHDRPRQRAAARGRRLRRLADHRAERRREPGYQADCLGYLRRRADAVDSRRLHA